MSNKGKKLIVIGLLLIAAAFLLVGYNRWEQQKAKNTADAVTEALERVLEAGGLSVLDEAEPQTTVWQPDTEMLTALVEGNAYTGILYLPSLGLELPVADDWSYTQLRVTPCRYTGTAFGQDLVICGHNYASQFGRLKDLHMGDEILFLDLSGYVFRYQVVDQEILRPTAVEDMKTGDWDLTLFTCTVGGNSRVTVRCQRVDAGR